MPVHLGNIGHPFARLVHLDSSRTAQGVARVIVRWMAQPFRPMLDHAAQMHPRDWIGVPALFGAGEQEFVPRLARSFDPNGQCLLGVRRQHGLHWFGCLLLALGELLANLTIGVADVFHFHLQ